MATQKKQESPGTFAYNRKARHDYHIEKTFEAGIMLRGAEAKSIRAGQVNLRDSYVRFDRAGELYLIGTHISAYQKGPQSDLHEPVRRRKLLLKKRELIRLQGEAQAKGFTLIPLKFYNVRGLIKLEIGLARGKKLYDKRVDKKKKDIERDTKRELKAYRG